MHGPVLPYALSVNSFIGKIGADAGFAAIIGVALLVIMVFVQARETSLQRDRAEDAEDRLADLEQYVAQVGRQATAAQQAAQSATAQAGQAGQAAGAPANRAAPAATGLLRPAGAPAAASRAPASRGVAGNGATSRPATIAPFAPGGVGAPALSSATRLIPRVDLPVAAAPALAAAAATSAAIAPATASAAPAPAPAFATGVTPAPAPAPASAAAPPPSTAAAGSPAPAPASASASAPAPTPGAPPGRAPRQDFGRTAESGSRAGRGSFAIAAILVIVIIVAAVLVITHHSSSSKATRGTHVASRTAGSSSTRHGGSTKTSKVVRVNPTQVRVAVLNGTATTNLAADVSSKLNKVGFQQGETANFTDSTQTSTTVGYLPGDRVQAIAVAKALGIDASAVAKVSTGARQIVCPSGSAACADQIVVTVGTDLSSDAAA